MTGYTFPVVGFCAFSGTGKTTLLKNLLPLLKRRGLRIGVVKHAHHRFEIDHPGKDSYELRQAGADQMLVASRNLMAKIEEVRTPRKEPSLEESLSALDPDRLDLVLVEGFKHERYPKIELHRPSLGKPLLCPGDPDIIAIATDVPGENLNLKLPVLDINRPEEIVDFIQQRILNETSRNPEIHAIREISI